MLVVLSVRAGGPRLRPARPGGAGRARWSGRDRPQRLDAPAILLRGQDFLAVGRDLEEAHAGRDHVRSALPQRVAMDGEPRGNPRRRRGRLEDEQVPGPAGLRSPT